MAISIVARPSAHKQQGSTLCIQMPIKIHAAHPNGQDAVFKCRQISCASNIVISASFLATLLPFLAWLLAFAYIVHRAQRTTTSDTTDTTAPTPSAVDDSIEYADGEGGPDGSCSDQSWVDGSEASDADEFARPGETSSNNKASSKERKRADVRTTRRLRSKGIMKVTVVNAKSLMKEKVPAISDSKSARKWFMGVKGTESETGAEMKDMATVAAELEANKPCEELDTALDVVDEALIDAVLVASGEAVRQSLYLAERTTIAQDFRIDPRHSFNQSGGGGAAHQHRMAQILKSNRMGAAVELD